MCLSILYVLLYQGKNDGRFLKNILLFSGSVFVITTFLLSLFDKSTAQPQFTDSIILNILKYPLTHSEWNINLSSINLQEFGVDGLSIFFILLTTFLSFFCFLDIWSVKKTLNNVREFVLYFLVLELFLVIAFITLDLLIFYIFFWKCIDPDVFNHWYLRIQRA